LDNGNDFHSNPVYLNPPFFPPVDKLYISCKTEFNSSSAISDTIVLTDRKSTGFFAKLAEGFNEAFIEGMQFHIIWDSLPSPTTVTNSFFSLRIIIFVNSFTTTFARKEIIERIILWTRILDPISLTGASTIAAQLIRE
jgi:hypothetical protein